MAHRIAVQDKVPVDRENAAPLTNAQEAAESVAHRIAVQDMVPVDRESAAPLTNAPEAVENAARPMIVLGLNVVNDSEFMPPSPQQTNLCEHGSRNGSLKLSPFVQEIHRGDKYIFINPNIPQWIVTDELGKLMLSLFDGENSYQDIIDIAIEGLGEQNRDRVCTFCSSVLASGLLDNIGPQPRMHRMELASVHLSLSDHCNLNCTYCYARERVEKQYPPLSFEEYKSLIDDILEINSNVVFTLTGGEPLLNKDCLRIAEYIKSKGGRTFLLSNGLLIDESNVSKIAELFELVTLSIDGPNDSIHSLTRGHNFDSVIRATELLGRSGVNYTLSMTVTRNNIGYVEEMAQKFGNRLNFAPYFPISGELSSLAITGMEYYKALKSAAGVRPLGYCESSLDNALSSQCHKCAIGDGEFSISATGDVYPCQLVHTDEFYAGNVHDRNIKDIYFNSEQINRSAHLDVDSITGCKDCPIKYICGGSCRARAFYGCGDINSTTDFCRYEQEAFYDGIISLYSHNSLE